MSTPASPLLSPSNSPLSDRRGALGAVGSCCTWSAIGLSVRGDPEGGRDHRRGRKRADLACLLGLPRRALLSGQTVFVTRSCRAARYIAVERGELRLLLNVDGLLSDLSSRPLSPGARRSECAGDRPQIVGAHGREPTMARSSLRAPSGSRTPGRGQLRPTPAHHPLRLPGGGELTVPQRPGAARSGMDSNSHLTGGRPADRGRRPGGLAAAVYGASEGSTRLSSRARARRPSRGGPPGSRTTSVSPDQRHRAHQPRSDPGSQFKLEPRPVPAPSLEPGNRRDSSASRTSANRRARVLLATGAQYRRRRSSASRSTRA